MEDFIKDKMSIIFSDFINNVEKEPLCDLKSFSFKDGKLPDYFNPKHQQLFLLRYFPAYLCEYKYLYEKIYNEAVLSDYNVLSIGCGCFLDYHGLTFASSKSSKLIKYTGIDIIEWSYNNIFIDSNIEFHQKMIEDYQFPETVDYNIIFFPKSISEISDEGFNIFLENLKKINFSSNRIYIISSNRDSFFKYDEVRYNRIIDVFRYIGYNCNKIKPTQELKKKEAFCYFDKHFYYPDNVKNYLNTLHEKCSEFIKNNNSCYDNCGKLSRSPILTTNYISFLFNVMER